MAGMPTRVLNLPNAATDNSETPATAFAGTGLGAGLNQLIDDAKGTGLKVGSGTSAPSAGKVLRATGVADADGNQQSAWGQVQTADIVANAVTQAAISAVFSGTRTAASYADVDSTNGKVTLTTTGGDLIVLWFGEASNSSAAVVQHVALRLDAGADVVGRAVYSYAGLANYPVPFCIGFLFTGVSAAAHSVFARHINDSAAGTMTTSGQIIVWERKR